MTFSDKEIAEIKKILEEKYKKEVSNEEIKNLLSKINEGLEFNNEQVKKTLGNLIINQQTMTENIKLIKIEKK